MSIDSKANIKYLSLELTFCIAVIHQLRKSLRQLPLTFLYGLHKLKTFLFTICCSVSSAHTKYKKSCTSLAFFSSNKLVYVVPLENEAEINFYSV